DSHFPIGPPNVPPAPPATRRPPAARAEGHPPAHRGFPGGAPSPSLPRCSRNAPHSCESSPGTYIQCRPLHPDHPNPAHPLPSPPKHSSLRFPVAAPPRSSARQSRDPRSKPTPQYWHSMASPEDHSESPEPLRFRILLV